MRDDRLEGRNPVNEALSAGRKIDKLWVLRPANGRFDPILAKLIYDAKQQGAVIVEVEKPALDKLSQTHAHQGVIAQTAAHDYVEVDDILAYAESRGEAPLILLLDEIQDAYNLGSIFRIADTAGVHGIIIPMRRSVGLDAVVAKASAGAIEHVRCARVNNLSQTIEQLKEKGLWIAGTDTSGINIYNDTEVGNKLDGPLALVVGSEGHGMRPLVTKNCDFTLSLPMKGKVNSLNAAVATGIILYEAVRRRGGWLAIPQVGVTEPDQDQTLMEETDLPAATVLADDGAGVD
ncbi:23S rRNA (guanosine(2251)-2'-O)-methyltransferase RlmB [Oscillospiraceae bacterium HV4-5-C5C]|nr:23S rRNA (guanosine(2251)-2'-O)-methyltransferase RlmB [Oscillospiraceae bacterium HV4-5-C5C]